MALKQCGRIVCTLIVTFEANSLYLFCFHFLGMVWQTSKEISGEEKNMDVSAAHEWGGKNACGHSREKYTIEYFKRQ